MKSAIAFIGLLAALSAHAHPAIGEGGDAMTGTASARPGLFGAYPAGRDQSGTSWQPDSTPDGFAGGLNPQRSDIGLRLREDIMVVNRLHGGGTFGVRALIPSDAVPGIAAYSAVRPGDAGDAAFDDLGRRNNFRDAAVDLSASYSMSLNRDSAVFGYIGLPGEPALGPPSSYVKQYAGLDASQPQLAGNWLDAPDGVSQVFTLGYVWRRFKLEGSAFAGPEPDRYRPGGGDSLKLDSRSGRLSFNPAANWALQFSRGTLSGLDQLDPAGEVRRTTVSATYNRVLPDANWQTTFAWGRNARKYRESTTGYLLESTLKVASTHAFFGRVEQVGSDDLMRQNESLSRQLAKVNKLTVGYFYDVRSAGPVRFDVGGLISRHYLPSTMTPSYGSDPTSYMMFVRLKLR
jgi:hypothetical protein